MLNASQTIISDNQQENINPFLDTEADLNSRHYPDIEHCESWFMSTNIHLDVKWELTRCASLLYDWLLYKAPGGCLIRTELRNFQARAKERCRRGGYSMRQIRNAMRELEELELIVSVEGFGQVRVRHPGKVKNKVYRQRKSNSKSENQIPKAEINFQESEINFQESEINFQGRKLISNETPKTPATATSQIPTYITDQDIELHNSGGGSGTELEEKKLELPKTAEESKDPPHAFVIEESDCIQPKSTNKDQTSAAPPKIELPKSEELRKNGVHLDDARLQKAVQTHPERLQTAITAFLEYCRQKRVEKPTRALVRAIERNWQPENPVTQPSHKSCVNPIVSELALWQRRWQQAPMSRHQIKQDIALTYPAGEIIILDDDTGPVLG